MLNSILDAKITEKVVRLGAQSTDERIAQYSLKNLERNFEDASINAQIRGAYGAKKDIEGSMYRVVEDIQIPEPTENQIKKYLGTRWAEHLSMMYDPPSWIVDYAARLWEPDGEEGEWIVQGKKGKGKRQNQLITNTYYGLWKRGLDIAFIQPPQPRSITFGPYKGQKIPPTQEEQAMYRERILDFFYELGYGDSVPPVPVGNRVFVQLRDSPAVWEMSLEERQRLAEHWEEEMRRLAYHNYLGEFKRLRHQYDEACEKYEAVSDEVRVQSMPECCPANCQCRGGAVY